MSKNTLPETGDHGKAQLEAWKYVFTAIEELKVRVEKLEKKLAESEK